MESDYPENTIHEFKKMNSDFEDIQQYLIEKIFADKYYNPKNKKIITFNANQTVEGLDSLKYFELGHATCDHEPEMDFIS